MHESFRPIIPFIKALNFCQIHHSSIASSKPAATTLISIDDNTATFVNRKLLVNQCSAPCPFQQRQRPPMSYPLLIVLGAGAAAYYYFNHLVEKPTKKKAKKPREHHHHSPPPTTTIEEGPPAAVAALPPPPPDVPPPAPLEPKKDHHPPTTTPATTAQARQQHRSTTMASPAQVSIGPAAVQVPASGGTSQHQLQNTNAEVRYAFKIKTTNNEHYRVSPVYGFVEAASTAQVEVTRLDGPPKTDDRLEILLMLVGAETTDPKELYTAGCSPECKLDVPMTAE